MFSYGSINNSDPNVFSFLRKSGKSSVVVSLNFSAASDSSGYGVKAHNSAEHNRFGA